MQIAYLVSEYPAYSHAFVTSEIRQLRERGWTVHSFSVNPTRYTDHEDAATTFVLKGHVARRVGVAAVGLLRDRERRSALAAAVRRAIRVERRAEMPGNLIRAFGYAVQAAALKREMDRRGVGHVRVHFANNAADVAMQARSFRGPVPTTWSLAVHGPSDFESSRRGDLAAKVRSAAAVTCISEYAAARTRALVGAADHRRLQILRMGVDVAALAGSASDRQQVDGVTVLFVGRLVHAKRPLTLVRAATAAGARLDPDGPVKRIVIRMVGDGPLMSPLRRAVAGMADDRVRFELTGALGHDAVLDEFRRADVFCLPSESEGVPVVIMEAMASGLPVVTTPVGGIPELVGQGNGRIVPVDDEQALAAALLELIGDPVARAALGAQGAKDVALLHDSGVLGEALSDLLSGLTVPR